jgi:hypothetical protein
VTVPLTGPELQPDKWGRLADDLDQAVATLRNRGVSLPASHRLDQASALLRICARARSLPPDALMDGTVVHAFRAALDFIEIARYMPQSLTKRDLGDYALAVRGSVAEDEKERQPYQYQTSLWFGTVLHRAGLNPEVPKTPRKRATPNPDYLVENVLMRYGVEIKRPGNWRGLQADHLPKALEQLAAYNAPGAVVVDVTDFVGAPTYDGFAGAVESLGDRLRDVVWDMDRSVRRPGYALLMGLVVFARGKFATSQLGDILRIANAAYVARFRTGGGTLRDRHAEWLLNKIYDGIGIASEAAGGLVTRQDPR